MIVPLALFAQIATSCGSTVDVATLAAVARAESRFDSAAINDNTARRRYLGLSDTQATVIATRLVAAGHSVDLGLMQVNSANLRGLGLSVADAFDHCKNIGAGAKVLVEGYHPPVAGGDAQPALYRTLSHYNTGSPQRGFANGYVAKVLASAEQIVPAIRITGTAPAPIADGGPAAAVMPPAPPSWDVFATARAARQRAKLARADSGTPPAVVQPTVGPAVPPPVQLQVITPGAGDGQ